MISGNAPRHERWLEMWGRSRMLALDRVAPCRLKVFLAELALQNLELPRAALGEWAFRSRVVNIDLLSLSDHSQLPSLHFETMCMTDVGP